MSSSSTRRTTTTATGTATATTSASDLAESITDSVTDSLTSFSSSSSSWEESSSSTRKKSSTTTTRHSSTTTTTTTSSSSIASSTSVANATSSAAANSTLPQVFSTTLPLPSTTAESLILPSSTLTTAPHATPTHAPQVYRANPFLAQAMGFHKPENAVYAVIYALMLCGLLARVWRGVLPNKGTYILLVILAAMRVATFAVRHQVSITPLSLGTYFKALLIGSGVLIVMGFLFVVEAVMQLIWDWYCVIRDVELPGRTQTIINQSRHWILVAFSLIGIAGVIMQIASIDKVLHNDFALYDRAKACRQASGALFLILLVVMFVLVFVVWAQRPHDRRIKKAPTGLLLAAFSGLLILEAVYRVWAASDDKGWVNKQAAVDVLIVMPEWFILLACIFLRLDDLGNITHIFDKSDGDFSDSESFRNLHYRKTAASSFAGYEASSSQLEINRYLAAVESGEKL